LSFGEDVTGGDTEANETELTPSEVIQELQKAWMNENLAPELLPHRFDVVDCVLDQIQGMEDNLARSSRKNSLRNHVHKMELERIRFMLCSYLRKRLEKIEQFVFHYLGQDAKMKADGLEPRMSPEERKFAIEYKNSLEKHMDSVIPKKIPNNVRRIDFDKVASQPNLDQYVFVRAHKQEDGVRVENPLGNIEEDTVKLEPGAQVLLPYKAIKNLVETGSVTLI